MASGHTNRATFVVVSDSTAAKCGTNVISRHRSRAAADRFAKKYGGTVEIAEVVALVRGGMPFTEAYQSLAGRAYRSVEV